MKQLISKTNPTVENNGDAAMTTLPEVEVNKSGKAAEVVPPLTAAEKKSKREFEETIASGAKTFFTVGLALKEVKDQTLYRDEFSTFETYVEKRWGFKRAHAYRQIEAAAFIPTLYPKGDMPQWVGETHLRPLLRLKEGKREGVWGKVIENVTDGAITAKVVEEAVRESLGKPKETKKHKTQAKILPDARLKAWVAESA